MPIAEVMIGSIARHPAYLPLVGVFAVVVAAIVLHGARVAEFQTTGGLAAGVSSPNTVTVTGEVQRLELARDGAPVDRVLVRPATRSTGVWVVVVPETRILVPVNDRQAVGGALDLAAGQDVRLAVEAGTGLADGTRAASITVLDGNVSGEPTFD